MVIIFLIFFSTLSFSHDSVFVKKKKKGILVVKTIDTTGNKLGKIPFTLDDIGYLTNDKGRKSIPVVARKTHTIEFGEVEGYIISTPQDGTQTFDVEAGETEIVVATYERIITFTLTPTPVTTPVISPSATTTPTPEGGGSIDAIIAALESHRPSWNTLDSYAAALGQNYPAFRKGLALLPGYFSRGTLSQYMTMWSVLESDHSVNLTSAFFGVMPPIGYTWPYSASVLDEKLRAFAAIAIKKKQQGLSVVLVNQPSDTGVPSFSSESEFKSWVTNTHLPMAQQEAQAAERMKAEYYGPFPKEVEVFLGSGYQPNLWNNLACSAIVDIAQWWINEVRDTAKKYYTGKLIAHSYANYDYGRNTCWQDISYTGYDEIFFTVVPTCSLADTASYLDAQMDGYLTVVANSGSIPWSIGEVWVKDTYFKACGNSLAAIEADVYSTVFSKVHSRTSQPVGIGVDYNSSDDTTTIGAAAMSVVDAYLDSH